MKHRFSFIVCLALLQWGCAGIFSKPVTIHQLSTQVPSRVTIALSVDGDDASLSSLQRSDFSLLEEDLNLDPLQVGLRLENPINFSSAMTVFLIDLSGDLSANESKFLESGLNNFAEKILPTQALEVYGFTGDAELHTIMKLRKNSPPPQTWGLKKVKGDPASRNLNGAVVEATDLLKAQLSRSEKPLKQGTLIVMSRGPDLAGRKSTNAAEEAIRDADFQNYFIQPEEIKIPLSDQARHTKTLNYASISELRPQLLELGIQVRNAWQRQYIISYCSPARSGERQLEVRVHYHSDSGSAKRKSARTSFQR